jgi:hypothetical protein
MELKLQDVKGKSGCSNLLSQRLFILWFNELLIPHCSAYLFKLSFVAASWKDYFTFYALPLVNIKITFRSDLHFSIPVFFRDDYTEANYSPQLCTSILLARKL